MPELNYFGQTVKCSTVEVQGAIDELVAAYVKRFGEEPDNVTGMVIRTSVGRVLDGEPYHWDQQGNWRRLVWGAVEDGE